MNSELSEDFVACFAKLPGRVQQQARSNYRLWKKNPAHPSLDFKRVGKHSPVYSVRVGIGWRAWDCGKATACSGSGSVRTRSTTACCANPESGSSADPASDDRNQTPPWRAWSSSSKFL